MWESTRKILEWKCVFKENKSKLYNYNQFLCGLLDSDTVFIDILYFSLKL